MKRGRELDSNEGKEKDLMLMWCILDGFRHHCWESHCEGGEQGEVHPVGMFVDLGLEDRAMEWAAVLC